MKRNRKLERRRKKYKCNGVCYFKWGECPKVGTCPETRRKEALSNAIAVGALLLIVAVTVGIFAYLGYQVLQFILWLILEVLTA